MFFYHRRYVFITIRSFHFFRILLKVYLIITKAEKNFQSVDSIERTRTLRNVPKVAQLKIKRVVLWEDQLKEKKKIGMMENDKWKTEYRSKNYGVGPPFFIHSDSNAEGNRIQ